MRNIILTITGTILGVLTLLIVMTINGRMNRSMELQSNLSSVVEETVENLAKSNKYADQNEFLADLVESVSDLWDSKSDIMVDILESDREKGLLAVKVTASFYHPNGKIGTVKCEKNVILNQWQADDTKRNHIVRFQIGDIPYKTYEVLQNNLITPPAEPHRVDETFFGWKDSNGNVADFSQPVTQDLVYYADFR